VRKKIYAGPLNGLYSIEGFKRYVEYLLKNDLAEQLPLFSTSHNAVDLELLIKSGLWFNT